MAVSLVAKAKVKPKFLPGCELKLFICVCNFERALDKHCLAGPAFDAQSSKPQLRSTKYAKCIC